MGLGLRVGLGIPVIDSVPGEAFSAHLQVAVELGRAAQRVVVIAPNGLMPHDHARIEIFNLAVGLGCDLLFFVDDDMVVPFGAFSRLWEVMKERGAQVVTGNYRRRGYPYTSVWSKDGNQLEVDGGVHEIDCSGLGCALIDVGWVVENLEKPFFQMTLDDEKGTIVTDDVVFYRKVKEKGGLILGVADVKCGHLAERTLVSEETYKGLLARDMREMTGRPIAATHLAVLEKAARETDGLVIELGGGEHSTPLLHKVCDEMGGRWLVTVEQDEDWLKGLKNFEGAHHKVLSWEEWQGEDREKVIGLMFVDHETPVKGVVRFDERKRAVVENRHRVGVFVVHDSQDSRFRDDPEWIEVVESFAFKVEVFEGPIGTLVLSDRVDVERWFEDGDNIHVDEGGLEKGPQAGGKELCVGDGAAQDGGA